MDENQKKETRSLIITLLVVTVVLAVVAVIGFLFLDRPPR